VCLCPFAKPIGVDLADHHTVALPSAEGTPSGPATYTTSRGRDPRGVTACLEDVAQVSRGVCYLGRQLERVWVRPMAS
jgi:hypothetical protein